MILRESLVYEPKELAFGTSGLRGLITDMTDLECYINTRGFLAYLGDDDCQEKIIYVGGDLRESTPRIIASIIRAIEDAGWKPEYCGFLPTPALAFYARQKKGPCAMVTGSHIPDDRNGIKFYKTNGEVLKSDEPGIKAAVATVRGEQYGISAEDSIFDNEGFLKEKTELPQENREAVEVYLSRYTDVFDSSTFNGKKIVFYQHSSVGRDQIVELLEKMGAEVVTVGRSDVFISIDTENVKPSDEEYFKELSDKYPDAFAIVSTDGDADRPFVVDERGVFHRGDELGALVADWLKADYAAITASSSDAVDRYLDDQNIECSHTKIGAPYVIASMEEAIASGKQRVVGWEVNGGFLLGCDIEVNGKSVSSLPTRDAVLPIIVAIKMAIDKNKKISSIFEALPRRYTGAGLINNFPNEVSKKIINKFSEDKDSVRDELSKYFSKEKGFGDIEKIGSLDGVRIFFSNGDIAHLRPSGNAPQLRIYSVADTKERANEIVELAIEEPNGIYRQLEKNI